MPGFIKTPSQEKKWSHAKEISDAIRKKKGGKPEGSNKYKLANWVYHHKLTKGNDTAKEKTKSDPDTCYKVYYLGKSKNKITVATFDNMAEAKEQIDGLRKLYGKYIKCGIDEKAMSRFDIAMRNAKDATSKRKAELADVTKD